MLDSAISVKQLNLYVKSLIESDKRLNRVTVLGEISNFKNHFSSGHWYFTLKDNDAMVRCVMFKNSAVKVNFEAQDAISVLVSGHISLYEKDGQYQFYVDTMHPFGEGDLSLKFKLLFEKLKSEGLFDEENKRPICKHPKRIAVITSATGAAVHDICSTLEKRMPSCEIVLCPVSVQGELAAKDMVKTLDRVYALENIDTVIIGRGGGSAEDLSAFNDEELARKIYESPFPVISAVGHEVDFTICDYVSDARAATPTGAAVIASEDMSENKEMLKSLSVRLATRMQGLMQNYELRLKSAAASRVIVNACEYIDKKMQTLDYLTKDADNAIEKILSNSEKVFDSLVVKLDGLSPLKILKRGYGVVSGENGTVTSVNDVKTGENIKIRLTDGTINCEVKE